MKIIVQVEKETYYIECGSGNQDISWLALAACHRYSNTAFPKGKYIPCQLKTLEGLSYHPRNPINRFLKDETEVILNVRDIRACTMTTEQAKWHRRAYGAERNMMTVKFFYIPQKYKAELAGKTDQIKVIASIVYKMFPELVDEFGPEEFPQEMEIELVPTSDAADEFIGKKLMPYGDILKKIVVWENRQDTDGTGVLKRKEVAEENVTHRPNPVPVSQATRQRLDDEEEQKLRNREEEVKKQIQKKLAQQATTTEQQVSSIPSKTMNEVWSDAPDILVPHFPLIYEVFSFYGGLHFPEEENELMTAHDFYHFLRTFDLISGKREFIEALAELEPTLGISKSQPLQIQHGIDLKKFLKLITNLASWRNVEDLNGALEVIVDKFKETKALWEHETVKSEMIKPEVSEIIMDNADVLLKKYLGYASESPEMEFEMKVEQFVQMVEETDLIQEALTKDRIFKICEDTLAFTRQPEFENLLYFDFLETLIRLAKIVPFDEDEVANTIADQPEIIVTAEKLHSIIRVFCGNEAVTPSESAHGRRPSMRR